MVSQEAPGAGLGNPGVVLVGLREQAGQNKVLLAVRGLLTVPPIALVVVVVALGLLVLMAFRVILLTAGSELRHL